MHEIRSQPTALCNFDRVQRIEGFEKISACQSSYLSDESKLSCQPFDYLFFPKTEDELSAVLREMDRRNVKVTVAGARTGLVGGCVPIEGALISLENFNQIKKLYYDFPTDEWRLHAECGVDLESIDRQLAAKHFPDLEKSIDGPKSKEIERFRKDPFFYFYPPDPTELSASLGGTVATNASGARSYRYGPTRNWVRSIKVMLVNGEIINIPRGKYFASANGHFKITSRHGRDYQFQIPSYKIPRTKNTAGIFSAPCMDVIDLFIGSEGIFGVCLEVTIGLLKRNARISVVQFIGTDEMAIDLVEALYSAEGLRVNYMEFFSENALNLIRKHYVKGLMAQKIPPIPHSAGAALFFEIDFEKDSRYQQTELLSKEIHSTSVELVDSWVAYEEDEISRLRYFRHSLPEIINKIIADRKKEIPQLHKLGTDLAVPQTSFRDMWTFYRDNLEKAGLEWIAFGHIGDGHLHINILPHEHADLYKGIELYQLFAQEAITLKGTISAEHGIGKLKVKYLKTMYSEEEIEEMRAIKRVLDPKSILNPGNIFDI